MRIRAARSAIFFLLLLSSCAGRRPGEPLRPGFNVYSREQDIELGRQAAAQIQRQVEVVRNSELQSYIDTVGRRLAQTTEAGGYPYEFTLINDKSINAFALPGGPVFVNTGLIAAAGNEDQMAGVLAHEIAHVALRHGTGQASKANLLQLPAAIAGAVVGQGSAAAQLGQIGLGLGLNMLMLRYSRGAEAEADALGARIMAQAGYNPIEMARFFEKLEEEGGARAPDFLSSHPSPGNRVRAVQAEIATFPQRQYAGGTGRFQRQKQLVAGLPPPSRTFGQSARGGQGLDTPSSAGGFRQLQAERFSIEYPSGWQAFGQTQASLVALAPQQGLVQDRFGNVTLGYGAIVSYFFPDHRQPSLRHATEDLVNRLRSGNPTLEVTGAPRSIRIDGRPGLVTTLTGASPFGGAETNLLLTVGRPEGLFFTVFVTPQRQLDRAEALFGKMVTSIRFRS